MAKARSRGSPRGRGRRCDVGGQAAVVLIDEDLMDVNGGRVWLRQTPHLGLVMCSTCRRIRREDLGQLGRFILRHRVRR